MTVKYVVSIQGELLYFDANRQPAQPFPKQAEDESSKPEIKLIPPAEHPAAEADWDEALSSYSAEQRESAEISVVI